MKVGKIEEAPRSRQRRGSSCSSKENGDSPGHTDPCSTKPKLIQESNIKNPIKYLKSNS